MTSTTEEPTIYKLFVGCLISTITEPQLKDCFSPYAGIDSIKIVRNAKDNSCKGYAFINVRGKINLDAILNSDIVFQGRRLDISQAHSADNKALSLQKQTECKIHVKNLHKSVDDHMLKEFFTKYGELINAYVIYDPATGASKKFGYVQFQKKEAAEKVLNEKAIWYKNKNLIVSRFIPKALNQKKNHKDSKMAMHSQGESTSKSDNESNPCLGMNGSVQPPNNYPSESKENFNHTQCFEMNYWQEFMLAKQNSQKYHQNGNYNNFQDSLRHSAPLNTNNNGPKKQNRSNLRQQSVQFSPKFAVIPSYFEMPGIQNSQLKKNPQDFVQNPNNAHFEAYFGGNEEFSNGDFNGYSSPQNQDEVYMAQFSQFPSRQPQVREENTKNSQVNDTCSVEKDLIDDCFQNSNFFNSLLSTDEEINFDLGMENDFPDFSLPKNQTKAADGALKKVSGQNYDFKNLSNLNKVGSYTNFPTYTSLNKLSSFEKDWESEEAAQSLFKFKPSIPKVFLSE